MRVSLEEFSSVIRAIHAAAASPGQWSDVEAAVARLMSRPEASLSHEREEEKPSASGCNGTERRLHETSEPTLQRLAALLEAHLQTAREVQDRLSGLLLGRLALATLDTLAAAAFVLDGLGTVYHCNAMARSLPKDVFGVQLVNSRFRVRDAKLNAQIQTALQRAVLDPPSVSIFPLRCRGESICELAISPLPADRMRRDSQRLALLAIATPQPDEGRIVERVRVLYGLTRAEARVMAALALGTTVEEIAAKYDVRPSTVRAQVRSIFDKTGAKRQTDLVRLALIGVPL